LDESSKLTKKIWELRSQVGKEGGILPEEIPQRENVPQHYRTGETQIKSKDPQVIVKNISDKLSEGVSAISTVFSNLMTTLHLSADSFI